MECFRETMFSHQNGLIKNILAGLGGKAMVDQG